MTAKNPDRFRYRFPTKSLCTFMLLNDFKYISMKKRVLSVSFCLCVFVIQATAQDLKAGKVPASVKSALNKKYPGAKKVSWEKEKGNYEANWGGKSGEDNSVQLKPSGEFIEIVKAMPVSELPAPVLAYVKEHYKGVKITEAGKVTDAQGKSFYEAQVNKKDLVFDEKGNFVKKED